MPLLSFEGVKVDVPHNLAGILFNFTAGSLTIHCRNFSGDIVLSKGDVSNQSQQSSVDQTNEVSSATKKRTIDLSASDDDEASAKRSKSKFYDKVEENLLLKRPDESPNCMGSNNEETKIKESKHVATDKVVDVAENFNRRTRCATEKNKLPMKRNMKQAKTGGKQSTDNLLSPNSSERSISRGKTLDSKKRNKASRLQAEVLAKNDSHRTLESASLHVKPAARLKWEVVESLGNVPSERWGHTFTKICGDRVVVYGGTDDDEQTLGDLHVFDMNTHRWTTPPNCETITRTWHDAIYLPSKSLMLVFGGERSSTTDGELDILSDIMVLDTESFLWYPPAIQGSPPSARSGHTCTALGNEVVVFGGSGGRNRQSSVHILDCDTWNWKTVKVEGKAPSARTYHSAVAVGKDKIVYFGGNDSCKSFNDVHVLQKGENVGSEAAWMWVHPCVTGVPPQERTGHSATLLNDDKIVIFGGWDPQRDDTSASSSVFSDSFLLDTKTWMWQPVTYSGEESIEAMARGRVGHGAVVHSDGRLLIFGGQNAVEQRLKDVWTLLVLEGKQ